MLIFELPKSFGFNSNLPRNCDTNSFFIDQILGETIAKFLIFIFFTKKLVITRILFFFVNFLFLVTYAECHAKVSGFFTRVQLERFSRESRVNVIFLFCVLDEFPRRISYGNT